MGNDVPPRSPSISRPVLAVLLDWIYGLSIMAVVAFFVLVPVAMFNGQLELDWVVAIFFLSIAAFMIRDMSFERRERP